MYFCIAYLYPTMTRQSHIQLCLLILLLTSGWTDSSAQYADHRNRKVDSVENVLRNKNLSDEDRLRAYNDLMWGYLQTDKWKSIAYAKKMITLGHKRNFASSEAEGYRIIGQHFYAEAKYDSAMWYYNQSQKAINRMHSLSRYTSKDIDDIQSQLWGTIANCYNIQGKNIVAIDYYMKMLELLEKHGWKENQSLLHDNIGELFMGIGNNQEAMKHLNKAINIARETKDSLIIAFSEDCLSLAYFNLKQYDKALKSAQWAYNHYRYHPEEAGGQTEMAHKLSLIYLKGFKNIKAAEQWNRKALAGYDTINLPTEKSLAQGQQAMIHLAKREWAKATEWAQLALKTDSSDPYHCVELYRALSKAYLYLNDKSKAEKYALKAFNTLENYTNKQYLSALGESEIKYETQKKEMQIDALQKEKKQSWIINIIVGILMLILLTLLITVWRWYRQRKQLNEKEKLLVETQATIAGETAERSRLARDLHDGLGSMLTAVKINLEQLNSTNKNTMTVLDEAMKELRRVAHHLMPDVLQREGLNVALENFCTSLPLVEYYSAGYTKRVSINLEEMLYRFAQELVNNAIKHSKATDISLQLLRDEENVTVIVCDNGIGMNKDAEKKGSGIKGIRSRLGVFHGRIDIDSVAGEGTEIHIVVPAEWNVKS